MSEHTMLPGEYLKLRRRAADLSIEEAQARLDDVLYGGARFLAVDRNARPAGQPREETADLARMEAGLVIAGTRELALIKVHIFPIDPVIYLQLAAGGYPRICRRCGCSQHDACFEGHATCSWHASDLCTAAACIAAETKEHRRHAS